jgi:hypothetical protein
LNEPTPLPHVFGQEANQHALVREGLFVAYQAYRGSNSQYAKAGSAIGETAIGQKYVKAVNQATDKSSDSGTVATHRK